VENANRVVSSEAEQLVLVDADDRETGFLSKAECHDGAGLLHRAFSVFLFNADGELLLQQRSVSKRLWPGFWSNSCCSHPRRGESMQLATSRRLQDELNIRSTLEFVYKFSYQAEFSDLGSEHELCHVYLGRMNTPATANRHEIAALRYLAADVLTHELGQTPQIYTPWLQMEWRQLISEHRDVLSRYAELS